MMPLLCFINHKTTTNDGSVITGGNTMALNHNFMGGINFLNRMSFEKVRSEQMRFYYYCLFAFGSPLLLVTIVCIADNSSWIPESSQINMGVAWCWIEDSSGFAYFYLPICCMLVLNTFFYAITARKIYQVQQETVIVRQSDVNRNSIFKSLKARLL